MGRLRCPKTNLKHNFQANSQQSRKLAQALAHPCVFPIAPRALVALFPLFGVAFHFSYNGCISKGGGQALVGLPQVFHDGLANPMVR